MTNMEATNMTKILEAVNNLVHFTIECANGHPYQNEKRKAIEDVINIAGRHTWIPCSQAMPEKDDDFQTLLEWKSKRYISSDIYFEGNDSKWYHVETGQEVNVIAWRNPETQEELARVG